MDASEPGTFLVRNRDVVAAKFELGVRSAYSLSVKVACNKVKHYKVQVIHNFNKKNNTDSEEVLSCI